jgi:hypothetical protein
MSHMIQGQNVSDAWLQAMEYLLGQDGGETANLAVAIARPTDEDARVRTIVDEFIEIHRKTENKQGLERISTVANTLFPGALYRRELGGRARGHLFEMEKRGRRISRRRNRTGTYFERLVAWPDNDEKDGFNQLEHVIGRLTAIRERGHRKSNATELGLTTQADVEMDGELSLRIYGPGIDNRIMGFPCLSHITLTLLDKRLHMTALYRNHHYVRRTYGNYVGLGDLLRFIACESGYDPGEMVCVSSHADAEFAAFGKQKLIELIKRCRAAIGR